MTEVTAPQLSPAMRRYSQALVLATFGLLFAGGLVTSTGSGLSVLDYPTTWGWSMVSFPWKHWVANIRFEHAHRLIAMVVGMLTMGLCLGLWLADPRAWMRKLGIAALLLVVAQGLLGGLTVIYRLPLAVSVTHGCTAQVFFCLGIAIAAFQSPAWLARPDVARLGEAAAAGRKFHRIALITTGIVFLQLVLGALMRHRGAGLAIPDFPLAFGRVFPPIHSFEVGIHFAHRVVAVAVAIHVLALLVRAFKTQRSRPEILRPTLLLAALTAIQITLGAYVVLLGKPEVPTTFHVAVGAWILGTCVLIAVRSHVPETSTAVTEAANVENRVAAAPWSRASIADVITLAKPGITGMVLVTTFVGFYLGSSGPLDWPLAVMTVLCTAMVSSGASALNQVIERDSDAVMARTANRPIPAGRLSLAQGWTVGLVLTLVGLFGLWLTTRPIAAGIGLASLALYVFLYTPLKKLTTVCTLVGAVPGALPPVLGWAAAEGGLSRGAWVLFAILFLWQLPHFYAIAWLYREDYAKAGMRIVGVQDPLGITASRHIAFWCAVLLPVSLLPRIIEMPGVGWIYMAGALVLGGFFLVESIAMLRRPAKERARKVFLTSLAYLPLLLVVLMVDTLV